MSGSEPLFQVARWNLILVPIDLPTSAQMHNGLPSLEPDEPILPTDLLSLIFELFVRVPMDTHRVYNEFPEWINKHPDQVEEAMNRLDREMYNELRLLFRSTESNITLDKTDYFNQIELTPCVFKDDWNQYYKAGPKKDQSIHYLMNILSTQVEPIISKYAYKLQGRIQGQVNCADNPRQYRKLLLQWHDDGQMIETTSRLKFPRSSYECY